MLEEEEEDINSQPKATRKWCQESNPNQRRANTYYTRDNTNSAPG
jgi:hypothetical protein